MADDTTSTDSKAPPASRFRRSSMISSARTATAQQGAATAPVPGSGAAASVPGQEGSARLTLDLRGFRFMSPDTGFMVAYGQAHQESSSLLDEGPVGLPANWRGHYNASKVTIKGASPLLATQEAVGATIEVSGDWVMDPKFGLQFQFAWAREVMPTSLEALEAYLAAGRLKGIGKALAKLVTKRFGVDTLKILDESPEKLVEIQGITEKKAKAIAQEWSEKRAMYRLTAFFGLYGVGETWVPKLVDCLGEKDLEARVRANPYLLTQVDGIGFATADRMAMALGFDAIDPRRVDAFLVHLLKEYTERRGHTACPTDIWFGEASRELGLAPATVAPFAQKLIDDKKVVLRQLPVDMALMTGRGPLEDDYLSASAKVACVSLTLQVAHERSIALDLRRLEDHAQTLDERAVMVRDKGLAERATMLDPSQVDGVFGVLGHAVSVLNGGPGSGKTTTLKSVLDLAEAMGWNPVLAAPTGRAAKRMEEAVGRPAQTIHRTLKYNPKEGFTHHRGNPMSGDLFVVDEASMLDNDLGSKWLAAIPPGARVVFVGDIDQLPSVGAGAFLKDLMDSGAAHVARLTRIHRTAEGSGIAAAAAQVVEGRAPQRGGNPWTDDFAWLEPPEGATSDEANEFIRSSVVALVTGLVNKGVPKGDIQVLSPQRDGVSGVNSLNTEIRWLLNAQGVAAAAKLDEDNPSAFVVGDRLLVTKNNSEKNIFNGDMGVVQAIDVDDGSMILTMENGENVSLDRTDQRALMLGSATTVHKSQGGERPVILVAVSPSHSFSTARNLLYTAITRGRDKVILLSPARTIVGSIRRKERMYRATGLAYEIERVRQRALAPQAPVVPDATARRHAASRFPKS
jgi:exodeoxyribonuclease V alpha subunit